MQPVRTINFVARQTGLSIHAIRIWEKRYGAVRPVRAENNRRLYTREDVERLRLLREATLTGLPISRIARASLRELKKLLRDAGSTPPVKRATRRRPSVEAFREQALTALRAFNSKALANLFDRASVELGSSAVLQNFIAPLAEHIGDLWRAGELTIAHEHFASEHIIGFLGAFARPYAENPKAPHLLLATPCGQLHELGAQIAAAAARSHGWRTTYLGPSLPVEEFAGAARELQPQAVALSVVYPPNDAELRRDLKKLRELLPKNQPLIVGGRSIESYAEVLREIKAIEVGELNEFFPILERLQQAGARPAKTRAK